MVGIFSRFSSGRSRHRRAHSAIVRTSDLSKKKKKNFFLASVVNLGTTLCGVLIFGKFMAGFDRWVGLFDCSRLIGVFGRDLSRLFGAFVFFFPIHTIF